MKSSTFLSNYQSYFHCPEAGASLHPRKASSSTRQGRSGSTSWADTRSSIAVTGGTVLSHTTGNTCCSAKVTGSNLDLGHCYEVESIIAVSFLVTHSRLTHCSSHADSDQDHDADHLWRIHVCDGFLLWVRRLERMVNISWFSALFKGNEQMLINDSEARMTHLPSNDLWQIRVFVCKNPNCSVRNKQFLRKDNFERHVRRCMTESVISWSYSSWITTWTRGVGPMAFFRILGSYVHFVEIGERFVPK